MKEISQIVEELHPDLEDLEVDRLLFRRRQRSHAMIILIPLVALIATGFMSKNLFLFGMASVVWLIISSTIYHFRAGKLGSAYTNNYKSRIIPRIVKSLDSQLNYDHSSGIHSSTFEDTELFTTEPDRYKTEDLVSGKYGATFLQMAEIDAEERRTRRDSDGDTETYYVTIFKGILLIADFHKHFQGRTFIFPDNAEKLLGNFGRFFQKMGGRSGTRLLRLEDPDFEKAFAAYSTDEVEARYILSTAMMRRLLDMQQRFGKDVRIGFKDSSLILAVPHTDSFLDPSTSLPATDTTQIRDMLFHLSHFLKTIEELDLNTRIWTKR